MVLFRKSLTCHLSPLGSVYRLFSTPPTHAAASSPASDFAVQYLVDSCGLPSDKAIRASRYLPNLKSPEKPDAVLQFLRQAGITEPHIKAAACRDPTFLGFSVDKCLKIRMAELQEIGFSPSHISLLLSICPSVFRYTDLQQKVLFWLGIFNSVDKLLGVQKESCFLLGTNLKISSANLSFLQEQCALSICQIVQLIKLAPRLITSRPEALKIKAKRAEELGIRCSSPMFLYALIAVSRVNQCAIIARLNNLKSLGLSQEEVTSLVSKQPLLLTPSKEVISRKIEFLIKEVGCDKLDVVRNPVLLMMSLEKRLIPRSLVQKLLESKGFPAAKRSFISFAKKNKQQFVEKIVLPYEHAIPGLHRAYTDACAGKTSAKKWFKNISN